jgi:hypothetical protein
MSERDVFAHGIEYELAVLLEHAHDLSERAKRANAAAQYEIERALEIADQLRSVSSESEARASELRHSRRGR